MMINGEDLIQFMIFHSLAVQHIIGIELLK